MPATPPEHAGDSAEADTSRIHDIGYRHYDGERLGRAYIRRSLFTQSLRGAYGLGRSAKSKVLPAMLLAAMCLPAAIIVAVTVYAKLRALPMQYTRYAIVLQAVIGLYLAAQAPQAVSRQMFVVGYFTRQAFGGTPEGVMSEEHGLRFRRVDCIARWGLEAPEYQTVLIHVWRA